MVKFDLNLMGEGEGVDWYFSKTFEMSALPREGEEIDIEGTGFMVESICHDLGRGIIRVVCDATLSSIACVFSEGMNGWRDFSNPNEKEKIRQLLRSQNLPPTVLIDNDFEFVFENE